MASSTDFDMPAWDLSTHPLSSTPRYQSNEHSMGRRSTPRWIKIVTSGTIGRFLAKWKNNPVQVANPDGPHDFTSSQLPHLSVCHAENQLTREQKGFKDNGGVVTDSQSDGDRKSTTCWTLILVFLGMFLVLASGGIPLLIAETNSRSNSSAVVSDDTTGTTLPMVPSTTSAGTSQTMSGQSTVEIVSESTVIESTVVEDKTRTGASQQSTASTLTDNVTDSTGESERSNDTMTTDSVTDSTGESERSDVTMTTDSVTDSTGESIQSDASMTTDSVTDSTVHFNNTSTVTSPANTTSVGMTSTTLDFTEESYSVITGLESYAVNETKIFYCTVYVQKLPESSTNVSKVSIFKYADNSKNFILSYDVESNVTVISNVSSRFNVIEEQSESNVTTMTFSLRTAIDPSFQDVCGLGGIYTCEFELSVLNIQQSFTNTSLIIKGVPADVVISLQSNYSMNTTGLVNCSAYMLSEDPDHVLELVLHNDSIAVSYMQYLNLSRDSTTIMDDFPNIDLTSSVDGEVREDCLTWRTNVYIVYFDDVYENLFFSCFATDLRDTNGTTIKSTKVPPDVV